MCCQLCWKVVQSKTRHVVVFGPNDVLSYIRCLSRQQGGGGPDRKAQHRRTQSSRPTEMGSQGSGGSSNSRRPSPTQQRGPDLPDAAQSVTLLVGSLPLPCQQLC